MEVAPFERVHQFMKLKDGEYRACARITPINQENLNEEELAQVVEQFQEIFNSDLGALQIKVSSEPLEMDAYLDDLDQRMNEASSATALSRIQNYKEYLLKRKECSKSQKRFYLILHSSLFEPNEARKDLISKLDLIQEKLNAYEMGLYLLDDEEWRELVYKKMNPRSSQTQPYDSAMNHSDLFPAYMEDKGTYIEVDGIYFRHYFITNYPEHCRAGWFRQLLEKNHVDIDIFVIPSNPKKIHIQTSNAIRSLQDRLCENLPAHQQLKFERQLKSQQQMLQDIQENLAYEVTVVITIQEKSVEDLERACRQMEMIISSIQMRGKLLAKRGFQPFFYHLPLCYTNDLLHKYAWPMHSETIASILPFNSSEITSNTGVVVGYNPKNDSLITIDRYDRKKYNNGNGVTFGASGSGKTFLNMIEIDRSCMLNTVDRLVIIDPEREFQFPYSERIVFEVGGSYCTNPFHLRSIVLDSDSQTKDGIEHAGWMTMQQTSHLGTWLKWIHPDMSAEESAVVSRTVRACYEKHGITETTEQLPVGFEAPTLLTFKEMASKESTLAKLMNILDPYIQGEYRSLFCGQTNWNMDNQLTVIDIHNLQVGMQSPLYDLILKEIWAEFKKDRNERTGLFCDEAHRLVNKNAPQTLEFIVHAFKQFRKYGSFIEIMTQQVNDIISMGTQYASQILANASFKKFLYMDAEWEALAKIQRLSQKELQVVKKKGHRGRGIILAGDTRALIQSESTLDQLAFMDPKQYAKAKMN